ncbi:sodium/hydrogen exchanger 10-like [Platysternon megacephalum]|uniref:Sodium/hydrogen exchanger 10-like n=1 Tax=Platysternon megacephalum TaxID=55544 RepID=A0A4D9DU38_9SAUR|nr:sodium/hydrogen exchanger 10-like [Platysternon megacephalum]
MPPGMDREVGGQGGAPGHGQGGVLGHREVHAPCSAAPSERSDSPALKRGWAAAVLEICPPHRYRLCQGLGLGTPPALHLPIPRALVPGFPASGLGLASPQRPICGVLPPVPCARLWLGTEPVGLPARSQRWASYH